MKLVIPVAGKGTRVRPLTHSIHKSLLPIAGKPVLQRIIDQVLATQGAEVSEIIFVTGHLEEQIKEWAQDQYSIPTTFINQAVQNGTGDAIRLTEDAVDGEDMMVIFADTLFDADLEVMIEDTDADGVIWTAEVADPRRFGVVAHDEDNWMTELLEKPDEPPGNLVNIGLYYVRDTRSCFSMIEMLFTHEMKSKGEYQFTEALDLMAKNGKKIRVVPVEGWYDCGTNESALATNKVYTGRNQEENSIHKTCVVEDSNLTNCIVMEGARLYNCTLENSIIGPRSILHNVKGKVFTGADAVVRPD